MSSWDDDEPLVLDEDFVRGAAIHELDHESRLKAAAEARKRAAQEAAKQAKADRKRRRKLRQAPVDGGVPSVRGPLVGALGAVVAFVLLVVFVTRGPYGDESGSTPTLPDGVTTTIALIGDGYRPGDCLNWEQGDQVRGQRATRVVDCEELHLIQLSDAVNLGDRFDHFPTAAEFAAIQDDECRKANEQMVAGFDPSGRYTGAMLRPLVESWEVFSQRTVWCGVVLNPLHTSLTAPAGAGADVFIPYRGRVTSES